MNLIKSLERLKYTLSNKNKPNETDIMALNTILKTVDELQSKKVDDNRLFGKLLCIVLKMRFDKSNDIDSAIKFLAQDLENPLDYHIELLASKIRASTITEFIETLSLDIDENELNNFKGKEIKFWSEKEKEFWSENEIKIFNKIYSLTSKETISDNFYITANELLNNEIFRS